MSLSKTPRFRRRERAKWGLRASSEMSAVISAARSAIRSVTVTERSSFARLRAPNSLDPRYDQGGEDADTPWWRTPFLEVPATERRRGPTRDCVRDDNDDIGIDDDTDDRFYVGDDPLWPTLSHLVLMSFALCQMVRALERHHDGEKLGESCVCNMTVSQLRQCAEDAVEKVDPAAMNMELMELAQQGASAHALMWHDSHNGPAMFESACAKQGL